MTISSKVGAVSDIWDTAPFLYNKIYHDTVGD